MPLRFTILFAATLAACAGEDIELPPESTPDSDLADELSSQPSYSFSGDDHLVVAEAAALRADRVADVDFEVVQGDLVVNASDGQLTIVDLVVELGDVTVPEDILPPNGLELTDISVALDGPESATARWRSGDLVTADLSVDLILSWATHHDGRDIPLADIRVEDVPISIVLERDGGQTIVSITANRDGPFWTWAQTFELRDLEMALTAQ